MTAQTQVETYKLWTEHSENPFKIFTSRDSLMRYLERMYKADLVRGSWTFDVTGPDGKTQMWGMRWGQVTQLTHFV